MGWATFWAIFSQTHPVTLVRERVQYQVRLVLRQTRLMSLSKNPEIAKIVIVYGRLVSRGNFAQSKNVL
jgi:hypothetical protein